ncbi:MAG: DNA mismatch repair protein MutS, partial [Betaproteobacteria bacterium]
VQVARLAGMPAAVVRQARSTLESLERRAVAQQPQVDLFAGVAAPAATAAEPSSTARAVIELLEGLQPDTLSPREALEALYRLKDAANGSSA